MSEDNPRIAMIRERITGALQPTRLEVEDESHKHAGHPGAQAGGGHFNVLVVSAAFEGIPLIKRHRMVYDAMGDAMESEIHALSIRAKTPDED
ncbi:MAG: BolA family protein [Gammaproteobacteria bacterium]|nr:BolA family protein [Gammaproteobacteria bacterium]